MKRFIFVLMLISSVFTTFSQEVKLGFRFDPNISWLNVDDKDTAKIKYDGLRPGFQYGLMADIYFTDNYGLSTGIFHNFTNGKTFPSGDTFKFHKWNFQYISIPLAIKLKTNDIEGMTYYGILGVTPALNVGTEIDKTSYNNIKPFNLSMLVGGGLHYELGGNAIALVGVSFHNGYLKLNKEKEFDVKASSISLDFGIMF